MVSDMEILIFLLRDDLSKCSVSKIIKFCGPYCSRSSG